MATPIRCVSATGFYIGSGRRSCPSVPNSQKSAKSIQSPPTRARLRDCLDQITGWLIVFLPFPHIRLPLPLSMNPHGLSSLHPSTSPYACSILTKPLPQSGSTSRSPAQSHSPLCLPCSFLSFRKTFLKSSNLQASRLQGFKLQALNTDLNHFNPLTLCTSR